MKPLLVVRHSVTWANTMLIAGIVLSLLYLYLFLLTGNFKPLPFIGVVFLFISGILYRTKNYFEVYSDQIIAKALVGPATRKYRFQHPGDLVFEGERIYIPGPKKPQRVWLGKLMADKSDWAAFLQIVRQHQPGGELHG